MKSSVLLDGRSKTATISVRTIQQSKSMPAMMLLNKITYDEDDDDDDDDDI